MPKPMTEAELRQRFGKRLRDYRRQRGMSLREMAARVGVSHVSVVNIEKGRHSPTLRTLFRISEAMDVSIDWLLQLN